MFDRIAESNGYRAAMYANKLGTSQSKESLIWLNSLVDQIWRVPGPLPLGSSAYPSFVLRGMEGDDSRGRNCPLRICSFYGGLEPHISTHIGRNLARLLHPSRAGRRTDVTYASLYSFSLGSKPPLLKSIEFLGTTARGDREYLVDVDLILEDMEVVLGERFDSVVKNVRFPSLTSSHRCEVVVSRVCAPAHNEGVHWRSGDKCVSKGCYDCWDEHAIRI